MSSPSTTVREREFSATVSGPLLVSGASRGFAVLLLGGLTQPLVAMVPGALGYWWLVVIAVVAFGVASWRATAEPFAVPSSWGAVAAVCSYLLIVPLVVMGTGGLDARQATFTLLTAVAVGTVTQAVRRRATHGRGRP